MMTSDDMKLARDGHLEYGTVPSSRHAWLRPVYEVKQVTDSSVFVSLGDGRGVIEYERQRKSLA